MTETEPQASHIDGLAYSREEDATATMPAEVRSWFDAGIATVGIVAIIVTFIGVVYIFAPSQHAATPNVSVGPTVTLTPAPAPSSPELPAPPASPPSATLPSAPVQTPAETKEAAPPSARAPEPRRDPDTVFESTWADQMPNYPYPDDVCVSQGGAPGCWPILAKPDQVEPVARAMCAYVSDQSKSVAVDELMRYQSASPKPLVHSFTLAQSREFVELSVNAYCPEYAGRK